MNRHLGAEIKQISNLLRRRMESVSVIGENNRLTCMHGWIIKYLSANADKDIFQKDIEAKLNIRRSTATAMLKLMESNGLIVRENVAGDARLKKIVLTDKAKELNSEIYKEIEKLEAELIQGIDAKDLEIFYKVIDKVKNNLE